MTRSMLVTLTVMRGPGGRDRGDAQAGEGAGDGAGANVGDAAGGAAGTHERGGGVARASVAGRAASREQEG